MGRSLLVVLALLSGCAVPVQPTEVKDSALCELPEVAPEVFWPTVEMGVDVWFADELDPTCVDRLKTAKWVRPARGSEAMVSDRQAEIGGCDNGSQFVIGIREGYGAQQAAHEIAHGLFECADLHDSPDWNEDHDVELFDDTIRGILAVNQDRLRFSSH